MVFDAESAALTPTLGSVTIQNTATGGTLTPASCLDIEGNLLPTYVPSLPSDPSEGSDENTYYGIQQRSDGSLFIRACGAELETQIEVRR